MTDTQHRAFFESGPNEQLLATDSSPYKQNPSDGGVGGGVRLDVTEFTSINKFTGMPDRANLAIEYVPRETVLRVDSLSLYLTGFLLMEMTPEEVVARITADLAEILEPFRLTVQSKFADRDGVAASPNGMWIHPDLQKEQGQAATGPRIVAPAHARS